MTLTLSRIEIRSHTLIPASFTLILGTWTVRILTKSLGDLPIPAGELVPIFNFYSCKSLKDSHLLPDQSTTSFRTGRMPTGKVEVNTSLTSLSFTSFSLEFGPVIAFLASQWDITDTHNYTLS